MEDFKEILSKKYGPLPGYAWAGIGAVGLVVVVKLRKGSSAVPTTGSAVPSSDGSLGGSGDFGGGGGGGADLPATGTGPDSSGFPPDPGTIGAQNPDPTPALQTTAVTAGDYFAANPLPAGTDTPTALAALSLFPEATYSFGAPAGADFSSVDTMLAASEAKAAAAGPIQQTAVTHTAPPPVIHSTPTKSGVNPSATPKAPVSGYAQTSGSNLH